MFSVLQRNCNFAAVDLLSISAIDRCRNEVYNFRNFMNGLCELVMPAKRLKSAGLKKFDGDPTDDWSPVPIILNLAAANAASRAYSVLSQLFPLDRFTVQLDFSLQGVYASLRSGCLQPATFAATRHSAARCEVSDLIFTTDSQRCEFLGIRQQSHQSHKAAKID